MINLLLLCKIIIDKQMKGELVLLKKGKILVIVLLISLAVFGCGSNNTVAEVNGENINEKDFYKQLEIQYGKEVLDRMINDLLIKQAAKKEGIIASESEINSELNMIKEQYGTEEAFNKALIDYNITLDELKESVVNKILFDKLATKEVKITEDEIKAFYEEHKEDFAQREQVRASHILVKTREEAEAIKKQLEEGTDFAKLAEEKSLDEYTKAFGGDLNYFGRGDMVPAFEETAFNLEVGKISEVVESDYGFHIIKVIDKKPAKEANFEETRPEIEQLLKLENARSFEEVIAELRSSAEIQVKWGKNKK